MRDALSEALRCHEKSLTPAMFGGPPLAMETIHQPLPASASGNGQVGRQGAGGGITCVSQLPASTVSFCSETATYRCLAASFFRRYACASPPPAAKPIILLSVRERPKCISQLSCENEVRQSLWGRKLREASVPLGKPGFAVRQRGARLGGAGLERLQDRSQSTGNVIDLIDFVKLSCSIRGAEIGKKARGRPKSPDFGPIGRRTSRLLPAIFTQTIVFMQTLRAACR
jgi:hypothetical protein